MPWTVATSTRVRYAETDGQRVAHHATYLIWFELGRAAYLRACGIDYNALEDRGLFLVVVEAVARYRSPARHDDVITIQTTLDRLRTREIRFQYRVQRDEILLATGETRLAMVNREARPVAIPQDLRRALCAEPEPPLRGDAIVSPLA